MLGSGVRREEELHGEWAALAPLLGPPVTTTPAMLTPRCSHLADSPLPGHSMPFLDNLSFHAQPSARKA